MKIKKNGDNMEEKDVIQALITDNFAENGIYKGSNDNDKIAA